MQVVGPRPHVRARQATSPCCPSQPPASAEVCSATELAAAAACEAAAAEGDPATVEVEEGAPLRVPPAATPRGALPEVWAALAPRALLGLMRIASMLSTVSPPPSLARSSAPLALKSSPPLPPPLRLLSTLPRSPTYSCRVEAGSVGREVMRGGKCDGVAIPSVDCCISKVVEEAEGAAALRPTKAVFWLRVRSTICSGCCFFCSRAGSFVEEGWGVCVRCGGRLLDARYKL